MPVCKITQDCKIAFDGIKTSVFTKGQTVEVKPNEAEQLIACDYAKEVKVSIKKETKVVAKKEEKASETVAENKETKEVSDKE